MTPPASDLDHSLFNMRLLPLLLLLPLAGCDMVRESYLDKRDDLMRQLDGTWTITSTLDVIYPDGTVVPQPAQTSTGTAEIAKVVVCSPTLTLESAGENDRVLKMTGVGNRCYVITTDHERKRLVFVGEGNPTDIPYTIDEASSSKQVWSAYTIAAGAAYTTHHRFTLTK